MECWKIIENTNYEISNTGKVRHKKTKKLRKLSPKGTGRRAYLAVKLHHKDINRQKHHYIHIEVAKAFISVPYNELALEVGHIKPDRLNNNVSNLRWVTRKVNMAERNERMRIARLQDLEREKLALAAEHPFGL